MTDNLYELVQSCLDTEEFSTIELHGRYFLVHQNMIQHSTSPSIGLGKRHSLKDRLHSMFFFS